MSRSWIGVDFDGTLAKSTRDGSLGEPIPKMVARVRKHLSQGETVKIFTARAPQDYSRISTWTKKHIGIPLEVTDKKDHDMRLAYDDKIKQVKIDTGEVIGENSYGS